MNDSTVTNAKSPARPGVLSAIENGLKWSSQDVRPAPPEQKTKFLPKGFFLKTFGAG